MRGDVVGDAGHDVVKGDGAVAQQFGDLGEGVDGHHVEGGVHQVGLQRRRGHLEQTRLALVDLELTRPVLELLQLGRHPVKHGL